jgi:hypothetical protein
MVTLVFLFLLVVIADKGEAKISSQSVSSASGNGTFHVFCHELYVIASWNKEIFGSRKVNITLNDPSCQGYQQNNTHIWVTVNFNGCGSIIHENGDLIFQENTALVTVTSIKSNVIERRINYNYNMRCIFDRSINVSTSNSFDTGDANGGVFNSSAVTSFNASMAIYDSSSFLKVADHPFTVTSHQPIFIGIKEINNNENFKFIVHQCFATPSSSRYGLHYMFFDLKCGIDSTFKMLSNSNDHFNFQINAFRFIEIRNSVFIHCNLYICKVNTTSPACTQTCHARKRRDLSQGATIEELPLKEVSVRTNEIFFQKKTVCDEMTCPLNSQCLELYPAQCRCNEGHVFNSKAGTCNEERVFDIHGLHVDMDFISTYSDPTSTDFLKLATDIEKQLTALFRLEDERIEGVKVISAREGSVVLDLALIYAKNTTKEEAFKSFVESVMANHTEANDTATSQKLKIKIKREKIPTIAIEMVIKEDNTILLIAVILPTLLIFVFGIIALIIGCKRSRNKVVKHIKGFENHGISMEKSS